MAVPVPSGPDFGIHPAGFRASPGMHVGRVSLNVMDLTRSVDFYREVLGLGVLRQHGASVVLGVPETGTELVEVRETPGLAPVPRRGRIGLYHFAILLPDRAALGRLLRHFAAHRIRPGTADHLVSEAVYINDPDGLGIEIYADRARDSWQYRERELVMAADPLQVGDLITAAGATEWTGIPAGTTMGHIHLSVGELDAARAFFVDGLGLDLVAWNYPGALFFSAGGYHHHVGTNIWAAGAPVAGEGDARLLEWQALLPSAVDVDAVAANLVAQGFTADRDADGNVLTKDPTGTTVRVRAER